MVKGKKSLECAGVLGRCRALLDGGYALRPEVDEALSAGEAAAAGDEDVDGAADAGADDGGEDFHAARADGDAVQSSRPFHQPALNSSSRNCFFCALTFTRMLTAVDKRVYVV